MLPKFPLEVSKSLDTFRLTSGVSVLRALTAKIRTEYERLLRWFSERGWERCDHEGFFTLAPMLLAEHSVLTGCCAKRSVEHACFSP